MSDFLAHTEPGAAFTSISEALSFLPKVGSFVWLATILLFLLPFASAKSRKCHGHGGKHLRRQHDLFPSIEKAVLSTEMKEEPLVEAFPQPCSTGLTTRLLPFKNAKGEIEWMFTDDIQPGQELDAFKAAPGVFKPMPTVSKAVKQEHLPEILSPVTSNSSNNESILEKKSESSVSPQINTPASTSSEDQKDDVEEEEDEGELAEGEHGSEYHQCPHCDAKFRMRGYLTRHLKKHMSKKAYQCPFHEMSSYKDEHDTTHRCHPSGGFSRRDTYKTHLKTRHFKFPAGTPIKGRSQSPGNCAMCGDWFQNAEIWSEIHVEGAECKYLPAGFQGKSRIKNKLKKQMVRLMKEEKRLKKAGKRPTFDALSPGMGTPNMAITPSMSNPSHYEDSPSQSSCSPMGQHRPIHQMLYDQFSRSGSFRSPYENSPISESNAGMTPGVQAGDYDDEFCLDTDQMVYPAPVVQPVYNPANIFAYSNYSTPEYIPSDQTAAYRNGFSGFTR